MADIAATDINIIVIDIDADKSVDILLYIINKPFDENAPLKKMMKKEFKLTRKPWITSSKLKSIQRKKLFGRYIKCKDKHTKTYLHKEYKVLRSHINTLEYILVKQDYYSKYFDQYSDNIKIV